MGISYRHAWELVDSMNRQSPKPIVEAATGGRNGGGACLTEEGEKAVNLFWKFYGDFQDFLKHEEKKLNNLLHKRGVR
jgi:molybdate transport system regulatory protein